MTTSFNKEKHEYLIDGKRATGVTTIIGVLAKPALIQWAANEAVKYIKANLSYKRMKLLRKGLVVVKSSIIDEAAKAHTRKKEAAGEHGTDTHALVEDYVKWCISTPNIRNEWQQVELLKYLPIKKFIDWAVENVDHFLFAERQMYDKELFVAGTADFAYIGKDGRKYMTDFKTSSGIYGIDYWLQVAAYRMLAEGEGDEAYDGATVVRMGKDGSFEVQHLYDYVLYKEAFLACLKLYRLQAHTKGAATIAEKTFAPKIK